MSQLAEPLGNRTIFRFYYPLALSWLFMAIESPISVAVLSRLPDAALSTASFFVMFALALWIESPVIDLLSTSTTLAKSTDDFAVLRRFALLLIGFVTVVHALVGFTPLFDWIGVSVLGVEQRVVDAAKPGFQIMTFWSACIGWRRFLQGVLIRFGSTKKVGMGTFVRMATMSVVAAGLYYASGLSSIVIAAIALMAAVAAESAYIHFAAMPVVRGPLAQVEPRDERPLTMRRLVKFHAPLTATTAVMMLGAPLAAWALAKAVNPILVLAGWQVSMTLSWLCRTIVFALPEVVITLYQDEQSADRLRRFCLGVGLATTATLLLLAFTGADKLFFTQVLLAQENVAEVAHIAFLSGAAVPLIGAMQSYVRGMLTAYHLTVVRFNAVIVAMSTFGIGLYLTIVLGVAGVISASIALTIALIAEFAYLYFAFRRARSRMTHSMAV